MARLFRGAGRITATRFPEKEPVADFSQGVQLAFIQALARYWATDYDWRKVEATLNAHPQFITHIDGLDIHFIHVRAGHGFSGKPTTTGWDPAHMARAWVELMKRLGYSRFAAQGGDWGGFVTNAMAQQAPRELIGIHGRVQRSSLCGIQGRLLHRLRHLRSGGRERVP